MTTFGFLEAALIAIIYFLGTSEISALYLVWKQPLWLGLIFGLIYGDVETGMIVAATLAMFYIGNIPLAGLTIQDQALACCLALPLAMKTGMGAEAALMIAIPFGVLGGTLDSFRRLMNGRFNAMVNKDIDDLNFKKMTFDGFWLPLIFQFVIRVVPCFIILYFAGSGLATMLENLPVWLTNAFSVIGGMLPALGMIMCATQIGQKKLIPFFFLGFILFKHMGMPTFQFAVCAILVAFIYVNTSNDCAELEYETGTSTIEESEYAGKLTKKDIWLTSQRVWHMHRASNSLEFLYGTSYCIALVPALRKIYGDNKEGLKEALHRHTLPYMTEQSFGNVITGAALAMEEEIANGAQQVSGDQVVSLKSGFMGPMASFGDTILFVTLMPIVHSICITFAVDGAVWPALWPVVFHIFFVGNIYYPTGLLGYRTGRKSILTLMKSGLIKKVMAGAGVLGMIMMGAVCASNVKLTTPLQWVFNAGALTEKTVVLQEILDSFMPNLLPLIFVGISYYYIQKGGKYIKLILAICIIGFIGSILGIL